MSDAAVYTDYVCPFCRLGHATLERYRENRRERGLPELTVEWHPFDLRADERGADGTVTVAAETESYVRSRWSEVEELADEYGVEMAIELPDYLHVDCRPAQLVALGLRRDAPAAFEAFHGAAFDALWTETRDVGDPAVLRELVDRAGADPDAVPGWLEDSGLAERFAAATDRAVREGVQGVPTVVADGRAVYGSRPPDAYRELFEA
jgi:predicted DsbA family dithiol-disulfide isomerase